MMSRFGVALAALALTGCSCGQSAPPDAGADASESLRRFIAIDVAARSACALRADGEAVCWGDGWTAPRVLDGLFEAVAGDGDRGCGLDLDGAIVCITSDDYPGPGPLEWTPPPGRFDTLALRGQACALDSLGAPRCWGYGQPSADLPVYPPPTAEPLVQLSLDGWACAVAEGGAGVCWHPFLPDDGTPTGAPPGIEAPSGSFAAIVRNRAGSCGLRPEGEVECWSTSATWLAEMGAPPAGPFVQIAAGGGPVCGLRPNGEVACWGTAWQPDAETGWEGIAGYQPAGETYSAIGAGSTFVCGIRLDGLLSCWGHDEWGVTSVPLVN